MVSRRNSKVWGSWHPSVNYSVLTTVRDAHQDGAVSYLWFWQDSDMMELCKVWVPTRKCTAVSPVSHSSA